METICGIYCIENIVNHKKYIGQSIDVYRRWNDHKNELHGHRHHNVYLQRAWDKYGEENFSFSIIEICDKSILDSREVYYINTFDCMNCKCGYNIESGGNANKMMPQETREKISKSRLGRFCGGNNPKAHPVYCPQLDRWFSYILEVEREGIVSEGGVRDCLKGKSKTAGKHPITGEKLTWYDEYAMEDPEIMKIIIYERNGINRVAPNIRIIPLYCFELDRLFDGGAPQVEREGIVGRTAIQGYLSGRRKSAGKHPITGEPLHWKQIKNNNI
jgi:group I intron endonuclease